MPMPTHIDSWIELGNAACADIYGREQSREQCILELSPGHRLLLFSKSKLISAAQSNECPVSTI